MTSLFIDIETCPDESRAHLFDLVQAPPYLPEPDELLDDHLPGIESFLAEFGAALGTGYLDSLVAYERENKNRAGALKAIAKAKADADNQRLMLSVTPEYCRVVMVGWAYGNQEPQASMVCLNDEHEANILRGFWDDAARYSPLIGFNILDFDLRVILVRSALLGVRPTRLFDTRPWGKDIVDLMKLRFPTGKAMGLKKLARLYGFPEGPVDDVDGSQVSELMHTNPEKLAEYCKSDIVKIRQLYKFYCGYFCEGPAIVGSAERAF
jgi:hypothetical protein